MSLHVRILCALVLGAVIGGTTNWIAKDAPLLEQVIRLVTEPIGKIWLAGLIMVVIPLILSSLTLGVANLGDLRKIGRIGATTLLCFLSLTTISAVLGLAAVNLVRPGDNLTPEIKNRLLQTYRADVESEAGQAKQHFGIDLLVKIVPRNPLKAAVDGDMLAVICFAMILGVALASLPAEQAQPLLTLLDSIGHATIAIIHIVMKFAPLGVFCLIFSVTARFGFDLLLNLLQYMLTVLGGMAVLSAVVYPLILKCVARQSPLEFYRRIRLVMLTAFATSSSNATLPTTIETAHEELGLSPDIAGFVLPLGATLNMNGTALFEGVTVLFLAQVFGVSLSLGQQVIVVLMSVVTAIGVAGIPGGSIPLLMMVLGMVGVPMEAIALILGVDRILDMCRTVLNVTGDLVTATIVARFENHRLPGATPGA